MLPTRAGWMIAGLKTGLHSFNPETGNFNLLHVVEPHAPNNRLNDGFVDSEGFLWFGSMDDNEEDPSGALYQLGPEGCLRRDPGYVVSNGPAESPDGRTLYHTDTLAGVIYAFDRARPGTLTNKRVFARLHAGEGYPDGPIVDVEGCVWTGVFGGWGLRRYSPQGELLTTLETALLRRHQGRLRGRRSENPLHHQRARRTQRRGTQGTAARRRPVPRTHRRARTAAASCVPWPLTLPETRRFRSRDWFDDPKHLDMVALYLERFMNYGLTANELLSGKPIIGIAQTGGDLTPCNRVHLDTVKRVREGIRDAGGVPMEFPLHPIFENCRRPTAALDRNLAYLGLVEILHGYPIDAVVLTTGCDKTTPAQIMAASTVDIPAIVLSGGPMLDGWHDGDLVGSGTVIWRSRRKLAAGQINEQQFLEAAAASAPSVGHCNTMGTASTMNAVAEVLGLSLPGCAAIPAPYRERGQISYETGRRIVEMAYEDLKPSKILNRQAFLNAIAAIAAIGGSTNAQPHLVAMARHAGVDITPDDWMKYGRDLPLHREHATRGQVSR